MTDYRDKSAEDISEQAAEDISEQAAVVMSAYMLRRGIPMGALPRRYDPQPPITGEPINETDCWTHAWEYAKATGAEYWEGVVIRDGKGATPHAFCVERNSLGAKIVELTEGYDKCTHYFGIRFDTSDPDVDLAGNTLGGRVRYSVFQTLWVVSAL